MLLLSSLLSLARSQTLYELVQSNENLTSFAELLAQPEYAEVVAYLNDNAHNATLFAPNNEAFLKPLPAEVGLDLVWYHIVDYSILEADMSAHFFPTSMNGQDLQIFDMDGLVHIVWGLVGDYNTTATLSQTDISATNGVLHISDTILDPPKAPTTVMDQIGLSEMAAALRAFGLDSQLDGMTAATVFAVYDPAFVNGTQNLTAYGANQTLQFHIVPDNKAYFENDFMGEYTALNGDSIRVTIDDTTNEFLIMGAKILYTDLMTANGAIHILERTIIPPFSPDRTAQENLALHPDLTMISALFETGAFEFEHFFALVNEGNNTLFAPTNEAFLRRGTGVTIDDMLFHLIAGTTLFSNNLTQDGLGNFVETALEVEMGLYDLHGIVHIVGGFLGRENEDTTSTVVIGDILSSDQVVIHVVDTVLFIPELPSGILDDPEFFALWEIIQRNDLFLDWDVLEYCTVFAIAHDGGAEALEEFTSYGQRTILSYHAVPLRISFTHDFVTEVQTLSGDIMTFSIDDETNEIVVNNQYRIIAQDILMRNGMLHILEHMAQVPPSSNRTIRENMAVEPRLTRISAKLEQEDFDGIAAFLDIGSTTFLAPDNDAVDRIDPDFWDRISYVTEVFNYHMIPRYLTLGDLGDNIIHLEPTSLTDPVYVNLGYDAEGNVAPQVLEFTSGSIPVIINKNVKIEASNHPSLNNANYLLVDSFIDLPRGVSSALGNLSCSILNQAIVQSGIRVDNITGAVILAPTDEAFNAYFEHINGDLATLSEDEVRDLVNAHLFVRTDSVSPLYSTELTNGMTITAENGDEWDVSVSGENVVIGVSTVEQVNILTQNGAIHTISSVLGHDRSTDSGGLSTGEVILIILGVVLVGGIAFGGCKQYNKKTSSVNAPSGYSRMADPLSVDEV
jgi:uncharacterized surface protein with fasciclin (FAS1) repeats